MPGLMPRFTEYLPEGKLKELRDIANAIVAPGKGILAADESVREYLCCFPFKSLFYLSHSYSGETI